MIKQLYKDLYVGNEEDVPEARKRDFAIVHCCKDGLYSHRSLLKYEARSAPKNSEYLVARRGRELFLNMIDAEDPSYVPDKMIDESLSFIHDNLSKGVPVLVHCVKGISRSPAVIFLYLYSAGKLPPNYHQALRTFRQLYPQYNPATGVELFVRKRVRESKYLR